MTFTIHMSDKRIIVAHPHGFCAGVSRAVATAEAALSRCRKPIYGLHEIVHNAQVTQGLAARGLNFVEHLAEIPPGAVVLLSAHGVSPAVLAEAQARQLRVIDATCVFVAKVHQEVLRFVARGYTVVCIGHHTHVEVMGIVGEAPAHVRVVEAEAEAQQVQVSDPDKVAVVSQTTLSPEMTSGIRAILRSRFPQLCESASDDICYATRNRQQAVRTLAAQVELVLVLGSANSSNTRRLVETATHAKGKACLIETISDLETASLDAITVLGITSGASTPETYFAEVLTVLATKGFSRIEHVHTVSEHTGTFRLPVLPDDDNV